MNDIRKLAGQTAIYGFGTVVPRFLNYALLTPFYTRILGLEQYGIVTELYAWMVLALVILTYGMETTYFRFAGKKAPAEKVYGTSLVALLTTSLLFHSCGLALHYPRFRVPWLRAASGIYQDVCLDSGN